MRFSGIILCLMFSIGCTHTPEKLKDHQKEFQREYDAEPKQEVKVKMATTRHVFLNPQHAGECVRLTHPNQILIAEWYWDHNEKYERWALVWHEMGHCVYGLSHPENVSSRVETTEGKEIECPGTLMAPSMGKEPCYDEEGEREEYIEELRERIQRNLD